MSNEFTRRSALAIAGAAVMAKAAFAAEPVFDDSKPTQGVAIPSAEHTAEMDAAPIIHKTLKKLYNTAPTIKEPNALQFTPQGTLLVLDQVDPNKVFELHPDDGTIIRSVQTKSIHGSGICIDDEGKWLITSTKSLRSGGTPVTLQVDPVSGKTLAKWVTPGWGFYGRMRAEDVSQASGGHDVKWAGHGEYWMAVPASGRIFLMNEKTGKAVRSIPAPVNRTHGLAIDGPYLWSVAADYSQIQKLDSKTGRILGKIQLDKKTDPQIHGLELRNGVLWYCDASSGWFCTLT